jgi:hypothetical protein
VNRTSPAMSEESPQPSICFLRQCCQLIVVLIRTEALPDPIGDDGYGRLRWTKCWR